MVDARCQRSQQHGGGHRAERVELQPAEQGQIRHALGQLLRPGKIDVTLGSGLRHLAEARVNLRKQQAGICVFGGDEDQMVEQLRRGAL